MSAASRTRFDHGVKTATTMMTVALNRCDPNQLFGVSRVGQVFGRPTAAKSRRESRLPEGCRDFYALTCG